MELGLIVAPSCNDCHGVHDIKRSIDRSSPINKATRRATPAASATSASRKSTTRACTASCCSKGDPEGPVCTDCHTAHEIETAQQRPLQAGQRRALRQVPRGQPAALPRHLSRQGDGARQDRTWPPMWPPATIATATTTCCPYPTRSPTFPRKTSWRPARNATPAPRSVSPNTSRTPTRWTGRNTRRCNITFLLMTGLLLGVFTFFGAHTLMWLGRSVWLYRHDSKTYREAKFEVQQGRRVVHPLRAVRALPALPGGDQFPAAGDHRHAAQVLLHRLGEDDLLDSRRSGDRAHAPPLRRDRHLHSTSPCTCGICSRPAGATAASSAIRKPASGS